MKTSKQLKLKAVVLAAAAVLGGSAFAQVNLGSGSLTMDTPNPGFTWGTGNYVANPDGTITTVAAGNTAANQVTVGYSGTSTVSMTSSVVSFTPAIVSTTGSLTASGTPVAAAPAGSSRTYLVGGVAVTTTTTGTTTAGGTTIDYQGNVTLNTGSSVTAVGNQTIRLVTVQDIGSGGSINSIDAYGVFDANGRLVLGTLQAATGTIDQYRTGTGPYAGNGAVGSSTVSTTSTVTGGNLNVGGNAVVSGTLTAQSLTTSTVTATTVNATVGNITTVNAVTGNISTVNATTVNTTNLNATNATFTGAVVVPTATAANQAVNLGQMNAALDQLDKRASAGVAAATAAANIPTVEVGKNVNVGVAVGNYNSQSAIAIGATFRLGNAIVKGSIAGGSSSKTAVGVGAGWSW